MGEYIHPNDVTFEQFKAACESSSSKTEVARKLGLKPHKTVTERLKELSLKFDVKLPVWENRLATKAAIKANTKWTPENALVYGKHWRGQGLRKWLIQSGVPYFCSIEECPLHTLVEWCGKPITLQVDHIDGDNLNNVISNLRFLCANCHTQTETFGSRNKASTTQPCECGRLRSKDLQECPHGGVDRIPSLCKCGKKKGYSATSCNACAARDRGLAVTKTYEDRFPSLDEMTAQIEAKGWLAYSKELGISDNGLRKVFRKLGVETLPKYIPKR